MSYKLVRTAILVVCLLALPSTFLALNSTPSMRAAVIASIRTVANAMGAALFSMALNSMAVLHIILAFLYPEYALTMTFTLQRIYSVANNLVLTFSSMMSALEITIGKLIDPSAAQYIIFLMYTTAIMMVYMLFLTVIRIFYTLWVLSRITLWVSHTFTRYPLFSALVS